MKASPLKKNQAITNKLTKFENHKRIFKNIISQKLHLSFFFKLDIHFFQYMKSVPKLEGIQQNRR